jgi:hypothetical protein
VTSHSSADGVVKVDYDDQLFENPSDFSGTRLEGEEAFDGAELQRIGTMRTSHPTSREAVLSQDALFHRRDTTTCPH